jgi:hypothetical protein
MLQQGLTESLAGRFETIYIPHWSYNEMREAFGWSLEQAKAHPKLWGQIVESAVGCHLLNHSNTENYNLYYWNENNNEVDFVIERNGEIVGLEVKTGKDSTNTGLSVFSEKFHPKHIFTIGTDGIDFENFFQMNPQTFLKYNTVYYQAYARNKLIAEAFYLTGDIEIRQLYLIIQKKW